jgi:hypothetical protein
VKASLVLSYWIKKLEVFGFKLLSREGSLNMPSSCSVKFLCGLELPFDLFLVVIVSQMSWLTSIVVFRCVSWFTIPFPRADNFSIAVRSRPS